MTHHNSCVLAVKDSHGRVLRESQGTVHLPFDSEYSLLIKNLTPKRACCSVTIDGTDVLGGQELILDANGTTSLERFLLDGDTSKGNRFKFVPASHHAVQDPSSSDNGLIVVQFWKEYEYATSWVTYSSSNNVNFSQPSPSLLRSSGPQVFSCCANVGAPDMSAAVGATVEGSASQQKFGATAFTKGEYLTTLSLRLVGSVTPITVSGTKVKYCVSCGNKAKYSDKYCGACGYKLS